jgi:Flp pilus assembly protein TadG
MFISRFMPRPRVRGFASDNSGTAGIEFALIAPIAVVLMLGAIEYSRAVVMARRFNLITATLGDLVARDDFEDDNSMQGLKHAMETIWSPYDKTSLVLQVVAVRKAGATATRRAPLSDYVYWPYDMSLDGTSTPTTSYARGDSYVGLPAGMLAAGGSTIIVNGKYTFKTLFGVKVPGFVNSTSPWTSSSSHSPRNLCVGWGSANCISNYE